MMQLSLPFRLLEGDTAGRVVTCLETLGCEVTFLLRVSAEVLLFKMKFANTDFIEALKKSDVYRLSVDLDSDQTEYVIFPDGSFQLFEEFDSDLWVQNHSDDFCVKSIPSLVCDSEESIYDYICFKGWS